jgi:hypothetical protein
MTSDAKTSQVNERPEYLPPRALRLGDDLQRGYGECSPGSGASGKCEQSGGSATGNCLRSGGTADGNCNGTGGSPLPNCNPGTTFV